MSAFNPRSNAASVPPRTELVVALHSSSGSARQWLALAERLGPACRLLAVDLHGHGAQPPWQGERPMTLGDEASLVAAALLQARADHGHGAAHLVGHSYGGAVAMKVASLYPELVASVAVYEPVIFRLLLDDAQSIAETRDAIGLAEAVEFQLAEGDAAGAAQTFVDYWSGLGSWAQLAPPRRAAMARHMPGVVRHFAALFGERWLSAALAGLSLPALVLTGAGTVASTRRIGERLRGLMPRAVHEVLPGTGHMGPLTHPQIVNERLATFLATVAPAVAAAFRLASPRAPTSVPSPVSSPLASLAVPAAHPWRKTNTTPVA
jgi:pimeloyl-ACP methyl ester carboxylesterase